MYISLLIGEGGRFFYKPYKVRGIADVIPAVGESTAQLGSSGPKLPEYGLLPPDDKASYVIPKGNIIPGSCRNSHRLYRILCLLRRLPSL